jgi:HPt (histidine-containing phosphotransfer) domain-containing protein
METSIPGGTDRIDRSVLDKLGQLGGAEFVARTVSRFLQVAPDKVRAIQAAHAEGDLSKMHELAHALKGSCGLVGAVWLSAAADRIEQATAGGRPTNELESFVRDIAQECESTARELRN